MTQRRVYQLSKPYFVTTNCFDHYPFFCNSLFVKTLSKNIFKFSNDYKFRLYSYSIMPDHLHLLLEASQDFNISRIIGAIKSKTAHELYKAELLETKLWHPRFSSRIINSKEEFWIKMRYIRNNSAGLESKYQEMPYLHLG